MSKLIRPRGNELWRYCTARQRALVMGEPEKN